MSGQGAPYGPGPTDGQDAPSGYGPPQGYSVGHSPQPGQASGPGTAGQGGYGAPSSGGYGPPGYGAPQPGYGYGQQPGYGPQPPGYGYGPGPAADVEVVGLRVGQYLLDSLLAVVPMIVLIGIGSALASVGSSALAVIGLLITLLGYVGALAGSFAVFAWWPSTHQGQTPAMGWLGVRIVRESDGGVPALGECALRWVLLIVDGIFAGIVGLVIMATSQRKQRLGDMAAHTLVVRA
ncbi:RDD family protein [Actinomycetospora atypica]|uniref:RDD family protein n=1 Tax=Actinomycetospora atypica TaxID=1290095 RepID=A0ABV9Z055_9PSEU